MLKLPLTCKTIYPFSSCFSSENRVEFGSESHLISLMDDLLNADTGDSVGFNIEVNPAGLFYEENGMFIPVHRNIPLVKTMGFTIGRAHNGIVLPIYNNRRQRIMASSSNDYVQAVINDEDARNLGIGGPVPAGSVQPSSITNTENRRRGNRRRH